MTPNPKSTTGTIKHIPMPARQKPPAPPPQNSPGCLASLFGFALFDRLMFPSDEEGFDDFLDDLFF